MEDVLVRIDGLRICPSHFRKEGQTKIGVREWIAEAASTEGIRLGSDDRSDWIAGKISRQLTEPPSPLTKILKLTVGGFQINTRKKAKPSY